MSLYAWGVIIAFLEPTLYGFSNLIDNYYSNHSFKYVRSIIIYGDAVFVLFLPLIFLIGFPSALPLTLVPLVAAIAAIELLYRIPFYHALRSADTSVVVSLFSLGRLFVPALAFFAVNERLALWQYAGLGIIVVSSLLLSKKPGQFRLNHSFFLMLIVTTLIAIQTVLYKMLFEQVDWATGYFWSAIVAIGFSMLLLLLPGTLRRVREDASIARQRIGVFFGQGAIDSVAEIAWTSAIAVIPVSVVEGVSSTQPLLVLFYAFLLRKTRFGKTFNEELSQPSLKRKGTFYLLILVGTIFVIWPAG
jgi:drug/metabolite transporter (DMT)-like permease